MIHDALTGAQFSYDAGTAGTVTVPAGLYVDSVVVHATNAGTMTITPNGANQTGVTGPSIPIPAGVGMTFNFRGQLGPGTVFVFTGTDVWLVTYAKFQAGAAR